jgi:hypothetical protein
VKIQGSEPGHDEGENECLSAFDEYCIVTAALKKLNRQQI